MIGHKIQDMVAKKLEKYFPNSLSIFSTNGAGTDITIILQDNNLLECEVKTALELFEYQKKEKNKTITIKNRRGQFNLYKHQSRCDFYAFVIRFVNDDFLWNGDYEIWWSLGSDIQYFLSQQTLNCENYKICIDKLPKMKATLDFHDIRGALII